MDTSLILASKSAARTRLLENAGVPFKAVPSGVNEAKIKGECLAQKMSAPEITMALARAKAEAVSKRLPKNLILGADQGLMCGGQWFDKPIGAEGVRKHLKMLSGRRHELLNAAVVVRQNSVVWCHESTINIEMRTLNEEFINQYIKHAGETAYDAVGAYNLEGIGIQLLRRVDGDFFSVLGLPLFPLLEFLRKYGILLS